MFSGEVVAWSAPGVVAQITNAGDEASARLSIVIIGLLLLAAVITIVTVVFWRMTQPQRSDRAPGMRWTNRSVPTEASETAEPD